MFAVVPSRYKVRKDLSDNFYADPWHYYDHSAVLSYIEVFITDSFFTDFFDSDTTLLCNYYICHGQGHWIQLNGRVYR
jgi:hypothetical protein